MIDEKTQDLYEVEDEDEVTIDLQMLFVDAWKGLKKFWALCLLLVLVGAAGFYCYAGLSYKPMYRAQSSFTVSIRGTGESNTSYSFDYSTSTAQQMADIFPYILSSTAFYDLVLEDLGVDEIPGSVGASSVSDSNLFTMTAVSEDPEMATKILEVSMRHFPEIARYVIGDTRLNVLEPGVTPELPYNTPNYRRIIIKGALCGAAAALIFVFLYALTKRTIRKREEFREILNIKCMGMVPRVKFKRHGSGFDTAIDVKNDHVGRTFCEAFSGLAYQIEKEIEQKGSKVILVTSTLPGEGKSTVVLNLARTLAETKKVLVIDGDYRKPKLRIMTGVRSKGGLAKIISGQVTEEDAIRKVESDNLCLIPAGKDRQFPGVLFHSEAFFWYMSHLREKWDCIIIDSPPCKDVADASILAEISDEILYVIKQDCAKYWQIMDGIQNVAGRKAVMLGGVLNGCDTSAIGGYGNRYYGYSQYGKYETKECEKAGRKVEAGKKLQEI